MTSRIVCDKHPDRLMDDGRATFDTPYEKSVIQKPTWKCTAEGCCRLFNTQLGYFDADLRGGDVSDMSGAQPEEQCTECGRPMFYQLTENGPLRSCSNSCCPRWPLVPGYGYL